MSDEALLLSLMEGNAHVTREDKRPVHLVLEAFCSALAELEFIRSMPVSDILASTACPFLALEALRHFETLSSETNEASLAQGVYQSAVSQWIVGEEQEITRVLLRHKVSRKKGGIAEAKTRKLLQLGLRIKELLVEGAGTSMEHCVGCARKGRDPVGHRLTTRLQSQRSVKRREQVRKKKCPHFYEEEEWTLLRQEEAEYDLEAERAFLDEDEWSLMVEETMLQVVLFAKEKNVIQHLKGLMTEKRYMFSSAFDSRVKGLPAPKCIPNPTPPDSSVCRDAELPALTRRSQVRWLDTVHAVRELTGILSSKSNQLCPLGIDTEWRDDDTVAILQISDGSITWVRLSLGIEAAI